MFALSTKARGDNQDVEGLNSLIKFMGSRAPRISLELLSARISLKKALSMGSAEAQKQSWKNLRPIAEGVADVCAQYVPMANEIVMQDCAR